MECPVCEKVVTPKRIGATIGGGQLTACPNCDVVFCEKEAEAVKKEKDDRQELKQGVMDILDYYNHRLGELQTEKYDRLGKPRWMDSTEVVELARNETFDKLLDLFKEWR